MSGKLQPIFITFQLSTESAIGKSRLAQLFVRVYDDLKLKTGYEYRHVSEILRRSLNDVTLEYNNDTSIERYALRYTRSLPAHDEALDLNFIELEFSVLIP